jgi:hypothetical protein
MTHPTYTQQALSCDNLLRLKTIAAHLGVTPTGDKRAADTWVNAIITHQFSQLQKTTTQASEKLTTVEISFYDHEIYAGKSLVAAITHDDDLTQPWVVMTGGVEKFRANTWAKCHRFIEWHHKDGTLNEPAAPTQTETPAITGNEITAQIFNECEKYGFEILDDGIYNSKGKVGEVGYTDGSWWVLHAAEGNQERVPCESALEAVWWLAIGQILPHAETVDCEELLDRPFEMLTVLDWELLREYEPVAESRKLVTT